MGQHFLNMLRINRNLSNERGEPVPQQPITRMVDAVTIQLAGTYSFLIKGEQHLIPNGFAWDGATIFRFLWTLLGTCRFGVINPASCIHDYLYINEGRIGNLQLSRQEVDELFIEHIIQLKITDDKGAWKYRFALRHLAPYFVKWKEKY